MKKILAVLLAALMLVCIMPVAVLAADDSAYHFETSANFATNNDLVSGMAYYIDPGVTMTVPEGVILYIPAESTLIVENGGVLKINGQVNIQNGGALSVNGTVINSDNVTGAGKATASVSFPTHSQVCTCGDEENCPLHISIGQTDDFGKIQYTTMSYGDSESYFLNSTIYIKVEIDEPVAKYNMYDEKYVDVYLNGVSVKGEGGLHETRVTTAGELSFRKFDGGEYFYSDCLITLPEGEGYDSETADGHKSGEDPYTVKFGTPVAVKINVDEDYNQMPYEVYIYNGVGFVNGASEIDGEQITDESGALLFISGVEPAAADEYGYYDFVVRGDSKITVLGVLPNEKLEKVGDILSIIRNIFEMIRSFFEQIFSVFGF